MHDIPGPSTHRARLVAFDLAALVLRAAAVGLSVALVLAGATLLFSSHAEADAGAAGAGNGDAATIVSPARGDPA
jgi:hypothetical protein